MYKTRFSKKKHVLLKHVISNRVIDKTFFIKT